MDSASSSLTSPLNVCWPNQSHGHATREFCQIKRKKEARPGRLSWPLVLQPPKPWNGLHPIRIPAIDRDSLPRTAPDNSPSQSKEEESGRTLDEDVKEEGNSVAKDGDGNPAKSDGAVGAAASFRELKNPPLPPPQGSPVLGFLQGVIDETQAVDWPAFPKVLSITGVVIGIILGSSLVLLTVNALLAELAGQVFSNDGTNTYLKNLF